MPHPSLFIDESGDPNFYARGKRPLWAEPNFEPMLILGMVVTYDRRALRKSILDFQQKILHDPLYNTIHSASQPGWYLHASKDHADVRLKFFEWLRNLEGLECYVVIGRKIPDIFHSKHNGKASEFYFDVLNKLLERYDYAAENTYSLYLSQRQSNTLDRFEQALKKALAVQSKKHDAARFKCRITPSAEFPELSVVDYLMWALKRYIVTSDGRYFAATRHQFAEIYDIYEDGGKGRIYTKADTFDLAKASSFFTTKQTVK